MKTALRDGEQVIKNSAANLQVGIETVGGKLYLTGSRLVFEGHKFNVQSGATSIELLDVASLTPCWTKLFGLIPLAPNSLSVMTKAGTEYKFVLSGRQAWIDAIGKLTPAG